MGVTAGTSRYALADLALALTRAGNQVDTVTDTATRAAAQMIGDAAGIQLLRDDGTYDPCVVYHPDPDVSAAVAAMLDRTGAAPDDPYSAALRATRRPVVLSPLTPDGLDDLVVTGDPVVTLGAAVLCPLIVDNGYLGHLVLVRTGDGGYPAADVDLARDIAGEVALALASTRSLERLRASEERYRRVLETIPEGVLLLDADGLATFGNGPIAAVLGLPREQLAGLSMHGFLDNRGQAELSHWLTECRQGRAAVGETRLVRADGTTRQVRISMVPMPDEAGIPGGSLCMVSDLTDRLDARGLKRQLDHLRRLDSLGQLIGGIAHDFNNLFTVVAGSADMIAASSDPGSTQQQLATSIVQATVTGRTLAHQLLAFGRGGGSRSQTIAVPDLIADVRSLFSRTLGEHVGLDLSYDPDVWPVRAERGPLEQVLVNIAANARDAMPRGGMLRFTAGNVTVLPGQLDDPAAEGRFVHLVVADTGGGMTEEVRLNAFEAFFTTKPSAAGLGLATAASIVRGIGGHISLESAPQMGTAVHLYLPAAEPVASTSGPALGAPEGAGRSSCRVLVVEDQPELAQLIQRLLEPTGYAVTVTTDARAALAEIAGGLSPDLVITDVVMPGMTGPELVSALRAERGDLPVVYMSGYAAASLGPQVQLDEHSTLVEKPFNRENLLSAIRRVRS